MKNPQIDLSSPRAGPAVFVTLVRDGIWPISSDAPLQPHGLRSPSERLADELIGLFQPWEGGEVCGRGSGSGRSWGLYLATAFFAVHSSSGPCHVL